MNNLKCLGRGEKKRLLIISNLIIKGAYRNDNLTYMKPVYFKNMDEWIMETPYFTYKIEKLAYTAGYPYCWRVIKIHNTDKCYKPFLRLVDPVCYERI